MYFVAFFESLYLQGYQIKGRSHNTSHSLWGGGGGGGVNCDVV